MTLPDNMIVRAPRVSLLARPTFVEPDHLAVEWKGASTDSERLVEYAERVRTSSHNNPAGRETRALVRSLTLNTHNNALDHASFSLFVEGVSRALTHQLHTHRGEFAVTELSQRHADTADTQFVIPPAILGSAELEAAWRSQMLSAQQSHESLVAQLMTRYAWIGDKSQRRKIAREAASGILPGCTASKLVLTANARSWRTLLVHLAHDHAELEARRFALCALRVLAPESPALFDDVEIYLAADRHEAARIADR